MHIPVSSENTLIDTNLQLNKSSLLDHKIEFKSTKDILTQD